MSSIIIINDGDLVVNMSINPKGTVRGEVYEDGHRFHSIDFRASVGGGSANSEERDISVMLPGVTVKGESEVNLMCKKLEIARKYAGTLLDAMANSRESSDWYLRAINTGIKLENSETVLLMLAITPITIDGEVVTQALNSVIKSGILGDLTSAKGLAEASDNVFHAIHNAVIGICGDERISPLNEEKDRDPNEVMSDYLRGLGLKAA